MFEVLILCDQRECNSTESIITFVGYIHLEEHGATWKNYAISKKIKYST